MTDRDQLHDRRLHMMRAGLLTTVQDRGRNHLRHLGVPVGGAMDVVAHDLANRLVGNESDAATLEMTLKGDTLRFATESLVALTGADFEATLSLTDSRSVSFPRHRPVLIAAGSVLTCGLVRRGCRGYLAVSGGIDVPVVMQSRSTMIKSKVGGFAGRAIGSDDALPIGPMTATGATIADQLRFKLQRTHPCVTVPWFVRLNELPTDRTTLRVIRGPHADWLKDGIWQRLMTAPLRITAESDRMGFRLACPTPLTADGCELLSYGSVLGAVQLPPDGQPILLLADSAPTGGYPCIAIVIRADLPTAAQLRPGQSLTLSEVTVVEARSALRLQRYDFDRAMIMMGLFREHAARRSS